MDEMKGEAAETSSKSMTSLVSFEFETEALASFGHIEGVSTHYRDLLRDGPADEQAWVAGVMMSTPGWR